MSIVTAHNLAKGYGPQQVFTDVSLEIPRGGKIALVGPNGSGKTTLLRLIAGIEVPEQGRVHRAKRLQIGYLPQHADFSADGTLWEAMLDVFSDLIAQAERLRELEAAMSDPDEREWAIEQYSPALDAFERSGGYTYEARIRQTLAGLGFGEDEFNRPVAQFSGGERTRALLARLLLEDPDLLLMDEPTNHLDLAGIEWLESYLQAWDGALVVVAHDREFLNTVAEQVWELSWGSLETYSGNYSAYVRQREERRAYREKAYEEQQAFIEKTEEFIRRNIAGQRTKEAQGRRKRLERMERLERPQDYEPLNIDLGDVARSGELVLGLYGLVCGYEPEEPLIEVASLELRRGECVALIGPNGAGKTTLVRTIRGELPPLSGDVRMGTNVELGYFAQGHANLDRGKTVLDTILDTGKLTVSRARDFLAQYRFFGEDVFKPVGALSGGEQARVALALLALEGANLLLLDEPTNHLDIPSQEVLQSVLTDFGGTMLMVSHDRFLIRALGDRIWALQEGTVRDFPYGYEQYEEWMAARRREEQERRQARSRRERERRRSRQTNQETSFDRERRQAELEDRIDELEIRLSDLEEQLAAASAEQSVERVRELGDEYREVEAELERLLADWTEVAA